MKTRRWVFLLAVVAAMSILAACKGGSPTDPDLPTEVTFRGTITFGGSRPRRGPGLSLGGRVQVRRDRRQWGVFLRGRHRDELRRHAVAAKPYVHAVELRAGGSVADRPRVHSRTGVLRLRHRPDRSEFHRPQPERAERFPVFLFWQGRPDRLLGRLVRALPIRSRQGREPVSELQKPGFRDADDHDRRLRRRPGPPPTD